MHICLPAYLVDGVDGRGEPAVDAEDVVVDDGGEGEVVEDLGAVAPHVHRPVLPQALVVEAVHLVVVGGAQGGRWGHRVVVSRGVCVCVCAWVYVCTCVIWRDSWLPRISVMRCGYRTCVYDNQFNWNNIDWSAHSAAATSKSVPRRDTHGRGGEARRGEGSE